MKERLIVVAVCSVTTVLWGAVPNEAAPGQANQSTAEPSSSGTNTIAGPIPLKPTVIAPLSASGAAEWSGNGLSLKLQGLRPGTYRLYAVKKSDGSLHFLAVIPVADTSASPDKEANDNRQEPSTTYQAEVLQTTAQVAWRSSLNPKDVARIE